jgi:hypothetical protein
MTARHEISRLAPSRADPFRSTARVAGDAERVAHFRDGTAMERWTEPEP